MIYCEYDWIYVINSLGGISNDVSSVGKWSTTPMLQEVLLGPLYPLLNVCGWSSGYCMTKPLALVVDSTVQRFFHHIGDDQTWHREVALEKGVKSPARRYYQLNFKPIEQVLYVAHCNPL